jgi:septal ring factor EnvC (AmiA/AmiB activator)
MRRSRPTALDITLGSLAVLGWGGFIYGSLSAVDAEQKLQAEVSTLRQAAADGRDRTEATAELSEIRASIASARNEFLQIAQDLGQAREELASTRAEAAQARAALQSAVEAMASHRDRTAALPGRGRYLMDPESVAQAQRALAAFGYGPLEADGVLGPNTRQALERFERDRRLTVTGELNPRTAERLGVKGEVASN